MTARHALAFATACVSFLTYISVTFALELREIYPAPPSGEKEWVEVYNESDADDDLTLYSLEDETGKKIAFESTTISSKGYGKATSTNILNNTGDTVILKKSGNEIKRLTYPGGISSSQSFSLCGDSWVISTPTALSENACSTNTSPTDQLETNTTSPSQTEAIQSQDYSNIYITEVFPYPESGGEWVELYNNNDMSVTLSNWYIDDSENSGSSPLSFSKTIDGKSYVAIDVTSSMFNNDGDVVRLLNHEKTQKCSISFSTSTKGKSMGVTDIGNSSTCLQDSSKGQKNASCIATSTNTTSKSTTSTATTSVTKSATTTNSKSLSPIKIQTAHTDSSVHLTAIPLPSTKKSGTVLSAKSASHKPIYKQQKVSDKQKLFAGIALFISIFTTSAIVYTLKKRLSL